MTQYRQKPIEELLRAYVDQIQKLERCAWEVQTILMIDQMDGYWLDLVGRIVQWGRGELDDADYRRAIRTKIRANRSSGTTRDLFEVMRLALPDTSSLAIHETYPASISIDVGASFLDFDVRPVMTFALLAKAIGVRLFILVSRTAGQPFLFGEVSEANVNDRAHGFSHTDFAIGGLMAHVIDSGAGNG